MGAGLQIVKNHVSNELRIMDFLGEFRSLFASNNLELCKYDTTYRVSFSLVFGFALHIELVFTY